MPARRIAGRPLEVAQPPCSSDSVDRPPFGPTRGPGLTKGVSVASRLPNNPSLEKLKSDARRLQSGARAGNTEALDLLRRWHPRPQAATAQGFPLHAAQLTLARRYGFPGWPALVAYLDLASGLTRSPGSVDETALSPTDRFCALACLRYDANDEPPRWAAAAALLTDQPGMVDQHIWAAAAAADPVAVRRHLRGDPALAGAEGGPYRWPPLLYLTYSRLPGPSENDVLATTSALLDAGADPNAGYLWNGLSTPFTALTGTFGEGEQGPGRQPRHSSSLPLARLLLDRGADPNDGQALYNRMFTPTNDHLELLFEFGLGTGDGGPWRRRLGEAMESPADMLRRQLDWAIDHQLTERVHLLVQHGIDLVTPSADGQTPRDRANALDFFPVIDELARSSARAGELSVPGRDAMAAAMDSGRDSMVYVLLGTSDDVPDEAAARRYLGRKPGAIAVAADRVRHPTLIHRAPDAVAIDRIAWAGFDVDIKLDGHTALHQAAWDGDLAKISALLAAGADPSIVDDEHQSTPLDWAEYAYQAGAADLLRAVTAARLPRRPAPEEE